MSGRRSPYESGGGGISTIPEGTYINPDTIPRENISMDSEPDSLETRPTAGNKAKIKLKKVGNLFKKKKTEDTGATQLGDVLGKRTVSSMASESSGQSSIRKPEFRDSPATVQSMSSMSSAGPPPDILRKKPERKSSFNEFFHRGSGAQGHGKMDSMRVGIRNFFHGPPAPSPPTSPDIDLAPMNPPPPRSPCRPSVSLLIIYGVILCIGTFLMIGALLGDSRMAEHCQVLAPCFLGLGTFGLIGNIYFMLWWKSNPLPMLSDCMKKINEKIGGIEDPYGLKLPPSNQRSSYYPGLRMSQFSPPGPASPGYYPISPTAKQSIPMSTISYQPPAPAPMGPAAFGSAAPGPLGPAAFGSAPSGPTAIMGSQSSWRPPSSYESSSINDESFDSRTRNSKAPSPSAPARTSYNNSSYQHEDEEFYSPGRIL